MSNKLGEQQEKASQTHLHEQRNYRGDTAPNVKNGKKGLLFLLYRFIHNQ
jgi:hypothetical protein